MLKSELEYLKRDFRYVQQHGNQLSSKKCMFQALHSGKLGKLTYIAMEMDHLSLPEGTGI